MRETYHRGKTLFKKNIYFSAYHKIHTQNNFLNDKEKIGFHPTRLQIHNQKQNITKYYK